MQSDFTGTAGKSSRLVPIFIFIVAILPITASVFLYVTDWRPSATVNHGELIVPARMLTANPLRDINGTTVHFDDLRGKWSMLYFGPSSCPADCTDSLYRMRQTHIAQGKESDRVQRVFVTTDGKLPGPTLAAQLNDYAGMHIWTADAAVLAKIASDFGTDTLQLMQQHNIYLIDPMGNLIMRYAPDVDPAGLRKDFERLLKYSGAG